MDKDKIEQLTKHNNALTTQLQTAEATIKTLTDSLKVTKVNNAIAGGSMLPASKEFALGLELNQIDGYIATLNVKSQTDGLQTGLNIQEDNNSNATAQAAVFGQLGLGA